MRYTDAKEELSELHTKVFETLPREGYGVIMGTYFELSSWDDDV